jgi:ribosomal protein L37AE/L43A
MEKGLYYTDHRLQYNYALDDVPITIMSSYCCHNCNSSMYISIHRRRIDNITSVQLWSCNKCGLM